MTGNQNSLSTGTIPRQEPTKTLSHFCGDHLVQFSSVSVAEGFPVTIMAYSTRHCILLWGEG